MTGPELQKENAPAAQPPERLKITFPNLAHLGAQKPAVIFDSYLTATEQIGHGGNGFAAAFGAGGNGENQITEGKLMSGTQNLRVVLHDTGKDSKPSANVHQEYFTQCIRLMAAQREPLLVESLTLVFSFFTCSYLPNGQFSGVRIIPDKDTNPEYPKNVASPSRRWDIAYEPMARTCPSPKSLRDVSRFDEPSAGARESKGHIGR